MRKTSRSKPRQRAAGGEKDSPRTKKPEKQQSQKLRIIGGSMRGRTVIYHGAAFTRPMKDSVRESLFNILGPRIKGTIAIDLFAGTGAVAFEAISRGATRALVVERNRNAAKFLVSTAETLGVGSKFELMTGDAFRLGTGLLGPLDTSRASSEVPRVVFLCPPYAMWESETEALHRLISLARTNCPPGSMIVAETDKRQETALLPAGDWDHRTYGGTRLSFLEPELVCGMGDFEVPSMD